MDELAVLVIDRGEAWRTETAELLQSEFSGASVDLGGTRSSAEDEIAAETLDVLVTVDVRR